jgi:hypothetical protein
MLGFGELNSTVLMWGVLFSSVGLGYFMYGKKATNPWFRLTGIGLMIYPMFVTNTWAVVGIGVGLAALPQFIDW